ncbi:MAG: hypothetical protein KF886_20540 [Candidatus Hydrogenedentes bacterium]|nr:hypothetical protein [Candidatus Hydrogenedentota bacterium]
MSSESLLEIVARHETELMEALDRGREGARRIVEEARRESTALLQEASAELDAEIGARRRDAAARRDEERAAIEKATAAEVDRIRQESAGRTHEVRRELIALLVPGAA